MFTVQIDTKKRYIVNGEMVARKIFHEGDLCWQSCESGSISNISNSDIVYEYIPENFVIKKALKKLK